MSSDSERLSAFIRMAKEHDVGDAALVALLRQNGWSERRIYPALSSYYGEVLGVPVPSRGGGIEYARDAFAYVLAFISLACWTVAVGHLFYVLIDRWLPSGLDATYYQESLRYEVSTELATIIVAFPIFVLISRSIALQLAKRPETADSGVRTWLTYVALVIAAVVLIGDAVAFLGEFLRGDLSTRFVLKSLVLLAIAGGVFAYYLASVRSEVASPQRDRAFLATAALAAIAALVLGFADTGTPAHARSVAADQHRVDDLRLIASAIHERRPANPDARPSAPASLDQLANPVRKKDPLTGRPYEYRALGGPSYELCASFETEQRDPDLVPFGHPAGRTCFKLDAAKTY